MKIALLLSLLLFVNTNYSTMAQERAHVMTTDSMIYPVVIMKPLDPLRPYDQPMIYARWWRELNACTGLYVPPSRSSKVKFVAVDAPQFMFEESSLFLGWSDVFAGILYVAVDETVNEQIVKHEMLHWISFQYGKPFGHNYLWKKCGIPTHG